MDYDVIVLGLGPGGEEVAGRLAEAGLEVLAVDPHLVGGECPYYGCIPSKMILRGAGLLAEGRRIDGMAGHADVTPDYTPVATRIRDEATDDWDDKVAVDRLEDAGATVEHAAGALAGRGDDGRLRVRVGDRTHTATRVVLATGTAPAIPPVPGLRELRQRAAGTHRVVWTNREIVQADAVPAAMLVIGGGAIGCELAQGFARFGSEVTIVETAPHILMPEEPEAGRIIADVLRREGVDVYEGVGVEQVTPRENGARVRLADGTTVDVDKILVAAGRRPNLPDIGLDTIGLDPTARSLTVDEHMRVQGADGPIDGVLAVGDITGRGAFTHVAVWQARVLINDLLDRESLYGGYHGLAWATFTDPEVGRVGMTEQQARAAGLRVRIGTEPIPASSRGWIHGPGNDGIVKLVEDADRGVLVGATVVSPYGGEILGALTVAVHAEVPTALLRTMHYAFPTLHRAIGDAVRKLA